MADSVASTELEKYAGIAPGCAFVASSRHSHGRRPISRCAGMDSQSETISALMERYAAGDDSVFAHLYRLMSPPLYRFCRRLTTMKHEADDCFQETLLRLHRARATYTEGANALHWVFAIARSVYLTRLRYWKRRPETLGFAADLSERTEIHPQAAATPEAHVTAQHLLATVANEL